ncbi:Sperm-associated antigen 6, partial [Globisporangium splendens]
MAGANGDDAREESHGEYLKRFWGANASAFMRWFLALPYAGQVSLLRNACPDIPVQYDVNAERPQAAQFLTPDITLKALLEENGKVLLRMMNARASRSDDCTRHDLLYLRALRAENKMPTFSGETFRHVSLAFIDPLDPEQNVQSLLPSASKEILDEKKALISQGKLIEADVWLTLQMRQQVIYTMLTNIAHTFETMFLNQVMVGEVTAAEVGCRFCGSSTRKENGEASVSGATSLLRCACEAAYYCCKDHQVEDWNNHKASCKAIRKEMSKAAAATEAAAGADEAAN